MATHRGPYFHSIDYLLDGLMGQGPPFNQGEVGLFFTQAFDANFFVLHTTNSSELNERLGNALSNIKTQLPPGKKIVYIGEGNIYPKRAFSQMTDIEVVRI